MKKTASIILALVLMLAFAGCKKTDDMSSQNSSLVSSVIDQTDTTSQVESEEETTSEEPSSEVSSNVSENSDPITTPPTVSDNVVDETPQEEINFIPNKISLPGSDKAAIMLSNKVLYNGTRYAFSYGKNNGVDCEAIITVDENGEYLRCVAILNTADNEQGIFTVCNGRIYYLKYVLNDHREFKVLQSVQICSMNLSGGDKRQEKEISNSFTHIYSVNAIADSKYMILSLYNAFDFTYTYYRYDVITKEAVKISTPEFDEGFYIHNNQLFCYDSDNSKFYKYDINFNNKQLLYDISEIASNYVIIDLAQDGFMITVQSTNSKYFLDLNGNITKK